MESTGQNVKKYFLMNLWLLNMMKSILKKKIDFIPLGKTNKGRLLFLVFTIRDNKIRIISAKDMNKKERRIYHEIEKDT